MTRGRVSPAGPSGAVASMRLEVLLDLMRENNSVLRQKLYTALCERDLKTIRELNVVLFNEEDAKTQSTMTPPALDVERERATRTQRAGMLEYYRAQLEKGKAETEPAVDLPAVGEQQ